MTRLLPFLLALTIGCTEYDFKSLNDVANAADKKNDDSFADNPDKSGLGGIEGRICAPDGHTWVSGALVQVDTDDGPIGTKTNGDGEFLLEDVPPGEYELTVQKGSFSDTYTVLVKAGEVTALAHQECTPLKQNDVRIAVITGQFDSIEEVLDHLGMDYDVIDGVYGYDAADFLADPSRMTQYDILFFNCGMYHDWTANEAQTLNNLRNFVDAGGSIYASDWAYWIVERSHSNMNTFVGNDAAQGDAYQGNAGNVPATVKDANMRQILGSGQASINYDLGGWVAIESTTGDTLIQGQYSYTGGTRIGPLATRKQIGNGTVLYTSFHNERQTTLDMDVLLQEIILSL